MDGVGTPVESKLITDPEATDFTDTTYDGLGRVWKVSNRYRSTSDASYGITTYSYDALGRVSKITRPDSSVLQTSYAGRAISVTDEGNGSVSVQQIGRASCRERV